MFGSLAQDSHSEAPGSISARSWMRVAIDKDLRTFPVEASKSLKGLNEEVLHAVALNVQGEKAGRSGAPRGEYQLSVV